MSNGARVIVIRHGIAEDAEAAARAGTPDAQRALTGAGLRKLRRAAAGLRSLEPQLAAIGHSPLRRTRETAEALAAFWPGVGCQPLPALAPGGDAAGVLAWVADYRDGIPVALVGHEPDLGEWIARAVSGEPGPGFPLRKAGMACIEFPDRVRFGEGRLRWLLQPKQLRRLASESG
ncbi:SixA phosphatase family protein [Spiribacter halobius]|uniref:Phosphohistidine phosphatase n=1 Tax=Sediminicurvatus halobius TaxID=2182432 RepID=A0A2U2MXX2_9GAMM|nr:histidine phosphatase family protein [Spiribacter halobius]PWG61633.1 phosphohistidine phosphatase [Spiribacter halobius]UEX79469.1 histidine phosphatase family protein [Spiribacter halobius]